MIPSPPWHPSEYEEQDKICCGLSSGYPVTPCMQTLSWFLVAMRTLASIVFSMPTM